MHPIHLYIKQSLSGVYPELEASAIAKSVLLDIFHFSQADLYAGKDTDFPPSSRIRLEDIVCRLKQFEPLQYIIGVVPFCGTSVRVSPAVLIPRPETAELVGWIVSDVQGQGELSVLDIGTGSGCIPIALSKAMPRLHLTAWDISEQALSVARENAVANRANIDFAQIDVLSHCLPDIHADIIVSNPPYITGKERSDMSPNVLNWEPDTALFVPDEDPLLFYRRIAEIGQEILNENGTIYFEINQYHGEETVRLLQGLGYRNVVLRKDLSGNDRMIKATRP